MSELNRFDLYSLCTQSPRDMALVLDAIHSGTPRTLAEDFSGAALTAREWLSLAPARRAIAVDHDREALDHLGPARGLTLHARDVMQAPLTPRADIIFVGNFSICELHTRAALDAYLGRCAARLARGGVLVCDLYDGPGAWKTGEQRRTIKGPRASRITYTWRQQSANPKTRRVINEIDFTVRTRAKTRTLARAFRYDWKLWSPRQLAAAMTRAGLDPALYEPHLDALDSEGQGYIAPIRRSELPEDTVLLVAGRKR